MAKPAKKQTSSVVTNVLQTITPAMAEKWLNSNNINRHLRQGLVEQYTQDMLAGKWTHCIVPIAFYTDGNIADGQHRLWAIVESKLPQKFYVLHGLSREDGLNIDTGLPRNVVDAGKISGVDPNLSAKLISTCRSIEEGDAGHKRTSNAHKLAWVNKHREAGEWVVAKGPKGKGLMGGPLLGAVGRAYYKVQDKNKLARFCEVLSGGFSNGVHESAAVSLRNYLMASSVNLGTSATWKDTFLKAQNAIKYFMADKPLTVIKRVADEAYPLK